MNIADIRRVAGFARQEDAALMLRVNRTSVARWESGANYPRPSKIPKLAELYGVTETDIHNACTAAYEQRRHTAQESSEQEVKS